MEDIVVVGQVGGQAVLGRQPSQATPWLTERHGYDPTSGVCVFWERGLTHNVFYISSLRIVVVGQVGGQAVLGRQKTCPTPWLTERHGYDPTLLCVCVTVAEIASAKALREGVR